MKRFLPLVAACSLGLCSVAHADVTFTTFAPGDVYNTTQGYSIWGPNASGPQWVGMQFTATVSGNFDSIRVADFYIGGNVELDATLFADDGSDQLGATLRTWGIFTSGTSAHIDTFFKGIGPDIPITAGQKYWVFLSDPSDGRYVWDLADASIPTGRQVNSSDGGTTYNYSSGQQMAAFDVNVNPVPEPASLALLGMGGLLVIRPRRRAIA